MASLVDIANYALDQIGEQTISTLDDATTPARKAKLNIYQTIREVSASGNWKCARASAVLAQDATAPAFGWSYAYTLPVDFIRIVSFNDLETEDVETELFEVRGRQIQTDETTASIVYIKDITVSGDVGAMPPLMVKAVYLALSAKLAWAIQQNRTLMAMQEEKAEKALMRARSTDAREEIRPLPDRAAGSNWISGRTSSTNG